MGSTKKRIAVQSKKKLSRKLHKKSLRLNAKLRNAKPVPNQNSREVVA